jgi:hypothetical protein
LDFAHHGRLPAAGSRAARGPRRVGAKRYPLTVKHVLAILDERYGFTDAVRLLREESGTGS